MVNALGLPPSRATRDIDFGLALESWEQFITFKADLSSCEGFRKSATKVHRLHYKHPNVELEVPVDLIPFGPIESEHGTIAWPPDKDMVMNVAGFDEALRSAVLISIQDDLVVSVASLPGLTILKLLAWYDRRRLNSKDASDLYTLLSRYATAGNTDRLYDEELDLLESVAFDLDLAGTRLLGRDVAHICGGRLRHIEEILSSSELADELIADMNRICDRFEEHPERARIMLDHFRLGFAEFRNRIGR
jgi:predicted nucleotidyltransferase